MLARSSLPAGIGADVSAGSALELTASPDDGRAAVGIFHEAGADACQATSSAPQAAEPQKPKKKPKSATHVATAAAPMDEAKCCPIRALERRPTTSSFAKTSKHSEGTGTTCKRVHFTAAVDASATDVDEQTRAVAGRAPVVKDAELAFLDAQIARAKRELPDHKKSMEEEERINKQEAERIKKQEEERIEQEAERIAKQEKERIAKQAAKRKRPVEAAADPTSTTAASAAKAMKARKSPAPAAAAAAPMAEAKQNRKRPAPVATTLDEDALLDAAIADAVKEYATLDEAAPAEASNKERFLERALEAAGTTRMNGGSILTDHGALHTLWGRIKKDRPELLRMYITNEGKMLRRRFVEDPAGFGDYLKARLARHRLAAMGCSERGVARKLHTPEHQAGMDELLRALKEQYDCYTDLSIYELERALLWSCLRFRVWDPELTKAVCAAAACYFGAMIAINVYNGGYSDRELDGRCALGATPTPAMATRPSLALRVRAHPLRLRTDVLTIIRTCGGCVRRRGLLP